MHQAHVGSTEIHRNDTRHPRPPTHTSELSPKTIKKQTQISSESNKHLTQALEVLRPLLSASSSTRPESLRPHVAPVSAALCGRGLLAADPSVDGELWEAGLEACRAVVAVGAAGEGGLGGELRRPRVRLDVSRGGSSF